MSKKSRRQVTGIIINNNKLSVGYTLHKKIKKMLYQKLEYNIGDSKKILGYLFYLKDIEPRLPIENVCIFA